MTLTKKGLQLKKKMWPIYVNAIQELVGDALSTEQVGALTDALSALMKKQSVR